MLMMMLLIALSTSMQASGNPTVIIETKKDLSLCNGLSCYFVSDLALYSQNSLSFGRHDEMLETDDYQGSEK
jgi:hypothetical protein